MKRSRPSILLLCALAGGSAGRAGATTALPLGTGTACAVLSEAETRAELGVKKRHAIVCADPGGLMTRVVITRKGRVECSDKVQMHDAQPTPVGPPCKGVRSRFSTSAPVVVNLTGTWSAMGSIGFWSCERVAISQDGSAISVSGSCGAYGTFEGTGQIDFAGGHFESSGTAFVAALGQCETASMAGDVSPDGQLINGVVRCNLYGDSFSARRVE